MKRVIVILTWLTLVFQGELTAQENSYPKIATDLQEEWDNSSDNEMFRIVILMRDQFDAQQTASQMKYLNKAQRREFVINELQRSSKIGQKDLLAELQQGQKAKLVDNIKTFWIFNGICCSATKEMTQSIAERPDVAFVSKEPMMHLIDGNADEESIKDNLTATNQWNVSKVNAPAVWDLGYTGKGIIVAVIDTGVNYNHTDIKDNMWDGGEEFPNHGWDFINDDNDPMDDHGHGTHCAGTVSSYGTNGKQCGIAKEATIMALKVLSVNGGAKIYTWSAIQFAVSHGADVLSMSLGADGTGGDASDRIVMENVLQCGVVAAVAAGNTGNKYENGQLKYPIPYNVGSPGNCPSPWHHPDQALEGGKSAVVTVGATTSDDIRSAFSSFGPSTWTEGNYIWPYYDYPWAENDPEKTGLIKPDIAAPGSSIVSLNYSSNDGYSTKNGTSMATPCVAGVMALMLEVNPTLTPMEIDSIIETTAVPCGGQSSKNNYYGSGRIDALAAITHILNACAAPTNLNVNATGFDVNLSWSAAANVNSYRIYRNGIIIAPSVTDTTYTDENVPAGDNTYFVRSNGNNNQASLPSNQVTVTIAARPTPFNLSATNINTAVQTIELKWNTLFYSNKGNYYYDFGEEHTAAQRFPSDLLQAYAGMQIEHFHFSVEQSGSVCTVKIYEGDDLKVGTLVYEGSYTSTEDHESIDYIFGNPIIINPNKTLWVTVTTSGALLMDASYVSSNSNALYFNFPEYDFWESYPVYSWSFQLELNAGDDYSYNLYRNDTIVASNLNEANVSVPYVNGLNHYQVTAYTTDYESPSSNSIFIVNGAAETNTLVLDKDDQLYGLSGSILTVNGNLSNDDPEHLILENGAQLIHNSEGVKATVRKDIVPYTSDENGWNFIASPVLDSIVPGSSNGLLSGNYDLYYYDEPNEYWTNYRDTTFTIIPKKGYLYANTSNSIQFVGTLTPSGSSVTISNLSHSAPSLNGFNLVGNPFACNATVDREYYIISNDTITKAENGRTVAPCEAIFVKASNDSPSITFTKAVASKKSE